ncbi:HupE/UreJ family protein [Salinibacterium sp. NSLL150]|uniref:HupE/UreJ family protein n=1 Tax=unclassified Salinibacterium TaxID=2632331 RepID=UPI0018CC953C|nr:MULTISPECIES: HupE/UreJ family protein [unclassified Salinibacterium]MBH0100023.1 HupE/UreJ family protein [Salinibacterium sp. NSLL35]MBH0102777.1 HupE/UreJ family protein [Salinibacterium sp. NSLL150]MBH0105537.1 HupE/UreJ family protein [Salinibacterium sp. NSLL16]MBH0108297.1 HupE/UreJ family protein [Salinibacterium sp. NSLL17]
MHHSTTARSARHGGFSPLARLTVLAGLIVATLALVMPTAAYAHDGTSEALILTVDQGRVVGTGLVEFAELGLEDTSGDGLIDATELSEQEAAVAATLVGTIRENVTLTVNGEVLEIIGAGLSFQGSSTDTELAASEYVGVAFASAEFEGELDELAVTWTFPSPSNAILLSDAEGAVLGHLSEEGAVSFTLGAWATASSFLLQGFEHIQLGPDHLLFLVVLALGVVGVKKGRAVWWPAIKLVTAFTVGHAISLCLAYFSIVSIPAGIVEPLIALSIVAASVLALRRKAGEYRWWIAGVVGLVHGLGFASSLSELGLVTSDHVIALICFNLGIDIAQTIVVLLVLAVAAVLTRLVPKRFEIIRVSASIAIGLIGLYWTVTRVWPF